MKYIYHLLVLIVLSSPTPARAAAITDFFSNCARPAQSPARILIVDQRSRGQGTFSNIDAALRTAKPGDTIALATGDYGNLSLSGTNKGGFITIAAAEGQKPRFSRIRIGSASHWRLSGLTISGFNATTQGYLVTILSSDNIMLDRNNLWSQEGAIAWKHLPSSASPESPSHGISARQSSCISIQDNQIRNVFHGIDFGGDQKGNNGKFFMVNGNNISDFAGDGIEHYGSHVRILNNRITNGHNLCDDKCVHSDGIQGWNYNHQPVVNTDVVIDSNIIIAQTTPDLALPIVTLQGITIFDGKWDGVKITNNLVMVNAWHGITVNRGNNVFVINNTIVPLNSSRNSWIMMNTDKTDPPGTIYTLVRRNNVVPGVLRRNISMPNVTWDHDVHLKDEAAYADAFVKFDPKTFAFDMRPSKGSPVIGAGSRDGAPATDIEGRPRAGAIDAGAYAYQGK